MGQVGVGIFSWASCLLCLTIVLVRSVNLTSAQCGTLAAAPVVSSIIFGGDGAIYGAPMLVLQTPMRFTGFSAGFYNTSSDLSLLSASVSVFLPSKEMISLINFTTTPSKCEVVTQMPFATRVCDFDVLPSSADVRLAGSGEYYLVLQLNPTLYWVQDKNLLPNNTAYLSIEVGNWTKLAANSTAWTQEYNSYALSHFIFTMRGCVESPSPSPSNFPVAIVNNQSKVASEIITIIADEQPLVTLRATGDTITPQKQASLAFITIEELSPEGGLLREFSLQELGWNVASEELVQSLPSQLANYGGSNTTFVYSTHINASTIVYAFTPFNRTTNASVSFIDGTDEVWAGAGAYVKFSIAVLDWQWTMSNATLRFTLDFAPKVARGAELPQPSSDYQTFALRPEDKQAPGFLMRLLTSAKTSDASVVSVSSKLGGASSASLLQLEVTNFEGDLYYDPDVALLLGDSGSSGGDDNTGLIVGVAVAIPLAVAVVLIVITGAILVAWYRKRRDSNALGAVHFDGLEEEESHHQL